MKRISKAEFFSRLARAVGHVRNGVEPVSQKPTLVASDKIQLAKGWALDMEIFIADPSHKLVYDNPVVQAIDWFARMNVSDPLTTLNDIATLEAAWEYYRDKTAVRVPFLRWDRDQEKFFLCDDSSDWESSPFLIFAR